MANRTQKVVLLTGPNGFIGSRLLSEIQSRFPEWKIKAISRKSVPIANYWLSFDDFNQGNFPDGFFSDVNHFVHLAAIAHIKSGYDLRDLEKVNVEFLDEILVQLNPSCLEKVIFLSSFAVSLLEKNIVLDTAAYAEAKAKSEHHLKAFAEKNLPNSEIVILRPPMVYGKGAPGNFESLVRLVALPVLLPFKNFVSPRASVHIKNLTSALLAVLESPLKAGINTFEIGDPWTESLKEFISGVKRATSGKAQLVPFPPRFLSFILKLLGKRSIFEKLALETHIDNSKFSSKYVWNPPVPFEDRFNELVE